MTTENILKELQRSLENATKKMEEIGSIVNELQETMNRKKTEDFHVGDRIKTSLGEYGEIVSVNGPSKYPVIALIHRYDVNRDDVSCFNTNGKKFGFSYTNRYSLEEPDKYTIEKI